MAAETESGGVNAARLRDLELQQEYNTEDDSIVWDFYAPCLAVSERYERAVGFFRANIYRELGEPLLDFVARGGRVRIVCSPDIAKRDEDAAREGYDLRGKRTVGDQRADLVEVMRAMSSHPLEADCLDMLRLLIERRSLDLYVAIRPGGIYHRKIGMFTDRHDDRVVFAGSGNETGRAVARIEDWANDEEFDVYRSWGGEFEGEKAHKKARYLVRLFDGGTTATKVRPLNEVERSVLEDFRQHRELEDCRPGARRRTPLPSTISPYYYQQQAIDAWERAGKVGVLSMATGTGKTYTALFAIREMVHGGNLTLIAVPTQVLFDQWLKELRKFFPGVPVLLAGAGHNWKKNPQKRMYVADVGEPRIILATMSTASSSDFIEFLHQAHDPLLVADEVHRMGSPTYRRLLQVPFRAKLGLSATPERLWDAEGNRALSEAFGETPVYDLPIGASVRISEESTKDVPILGHILSPYSYDFEKVYLTESEQRQWGRLTEEVRKTVAQDPSQLEEGSLAEASNKLKMLLIRRARILKTAENKVEVAAKILSSQYPRDGRWLIYCEDSRQLDSVTDRLRDEVKQVAVMKYDSRMDSSQRRRVLDHFRDNPAIIVSIRCLDEGVDIPAANGAVILASSKNPRQYIQRRGRVLRKALGLGRAQIIDALVLPATEGGSVDPLSIVRSELARAYAFAQHAVNKEVTHRLWRVCMKYDVDPEIDPELAMPEEED